MLTPKDAHQLSRLMTEPDIFPEAKQAFSQTLLAYYKELLTSNPRPPIPTPRRMW